MNQPPSYAAILTNRLDKSLFTISQLSELLIKNGAFKGDPDDIDVPPPIDDFGESGIHEAIHLIAEMACRDIGELAKDLELLP